MSENKKIKTIVIDKKMCIGAATCVIFAPEAFKLNDEGIAEVLATAEGVSDEDLIAAAKSCATQAITLLDESGNKISL